jgi:hypothetical protein
MRLLATGVRVTRAIRLWCLASERRQCVAEPKMLWGREGGRNCGSVGCFAPCCWVDDDRGAPCAGSWKLRRSVARGVGVFRQQ